jgi:cohesin loading factor subunit SCC2
VTDLRRLGPLEKFLSVVEEIFESEDSLPTELGPEDLPHEFFSSLSIDSTHPLLSTSVIRKLLKYIGQIARPTKRMRQAGAGGPSGLATPSRRSGRMSDVEPQTLSRLLKMLDRTVQSGQDLDPFQQTSGGSSANANGMVSGRSSPVKKSRKTKKAKEDDDAMDVDEGEVEESQRSSKKESAATSFPSDAELDTLTKVLDQARDSVLAADCCIALLASDRLPKQVSEVPPFMRHSLIYVQLYSEELIISCLNAVKNQMTQVLFPFVEGTSPDNARIYNATLIQHLVKNDYHDGNSSRHSASSQSHNRKQMSEIFQALSAVLPRINALANAESVAMSSDIIIKAVYIAVGPFFVIESEESSSKSSKKDKETIVNRILGKSAMRGLRLDALALIRSVRLFSYLLNL